MLEMMDFGGNPYVGVYCASNNDIIFIPRFITTKQRKRLEKVLGVQSQTMTLGGSTVLGAVMALNNKGALVTNFATAEELRVVEELRVEIMPQRKLNAVGNNILCNDKGAIVHPGYTRESIRLIEDVLDVEVSRGTVGGLKTVGSASVSNSKGVLCHPYVKESESELIEDLLKAPVMASTANYGTPQIGACIVANDKGAIVGSATTPIEVGRIEEGLGYY